MIEPTPIRMVRDCRARTSERGSALVTVAVSLFVLMLLSGLAIDLANLYVARSEVQRAADAAALAGATAFVTSGYTSGGTDQGTAETQATNQATQFVAQNNGTLAASSPTFTFPGSGTVNPQITVTVQRKVQLFFLAAFGLGNTNVGSGTNNASLVAASATAEAYNPSGQSSGPSFCAGCLKPLMIANCDPDTAHVSARGSCPAGMNFFVDPNSGQIEYSQNFSSGGVIGEPILIQYATSAAGNPAYAPGGMPSGSVGWYGVSIDGSGSVTEWPGDITSCNSALHTCNDILQTVDVKGAGMVPAQETTSFDNLIHATGPGLGAGQDIITVPSTLNSNMPYSIQGGPSNPNTNVIAQQITQSDSIATFPIYNGQSYGMTPPSGTPLTIIGFMQLFIQNVDAAGNITATILNIAGCGTNGSAGSCSAGYGGGGSGPSGVVSGGGSSAVPVRLISTGS